MTVNIVFRQEDRTLALPYPRASTGPNAAPV